MIAKISMLLLLLISIESKRMTNCFCCYYCLMYSDSIAVAALWDKAIGLYFQRCVARDGDNGDRGQVVRVLVEQAWVPGKNDRRYLSLERIGLTDAKRRIKMDLGRDLSGITVNAIPKPYENLNHQRYFICKYVAKNVGLYFTRVLGFVMTVTT